MFKYFFIVFFIFLFTGCIQKTNLKNKIVYKKTYKQISSDAILEAGKKIFILADKERKFKIDSHRNKLEVSKVKFHSAFFKTNLYLDKWIMEVVQDKDSNTRVFLDLQRFDALDLNKEYKIDKAEVFNVFWNRLDYLLGLNDKWISCDNYIKNVTYDALLCDIGFLSDNVAKKEDLIKNIYLAQRNKKIYTVETIDADVYRVTDLTIKKNKNDIFTPKNENKNNESLDPIVEKDILEKEDKKERESQKELDDFKDEIDNAINSREKIEDSEITNIIDTENEIQENSEFLLDNISIEKQ